MNVYLVGGAVRDELLGLPIKERDWVIVGATAEQVAALGYTPVGKDFPVFLHPKTKEEYALARSERKVGPGYHGFVFHAAPDVTLEEDLKRRDLTINAIAKSEGGTIIDPYNGKVDLNNRLLRHVSPAFIEDPVRLLRIARFAAQLGDFNFTIAPETQILLREMVNNGEVDALVAERVWQEWHKALQTAHPEIFLHVLNECGALQKIFAELKFFYDKQFIAQVKSDYFQALQSAVQLSSDVTIRFAVLWYGLTGLAEGEKQLQEFCRRFKVPSDYRDLALLTMRHWQQYQQARKMNAQQLVGLFENLDAFRREKRWQQFLTACQAIAPTKSVTDYLQQVYNIAKQVPVQPLIAQGLQGVAIANALREARIKSVEMVLNKKEI